MQEDEDEVHEIKRDNKMLEGQSSLLKTMKKQIFEVPSYQEVDQKCQSFKSFVNLLRTNQLFKDLMVEKQNKAAGGTTTGRPLDRPRTDAGVSKPSGSLIANRNIESPSSSLVGFPGPTPGGGGSFSGTPGGPGDYGSAVSGGTPGGPSFVGTPGGPGFSGTPGGPSHGTPGGPPPATAPPNLDQGMHSISFRDAN